ncbi:MAG: adenylyltransferase/cytidyltransferase family protein [Actinobacteria bacterium]|nr:adenylyltransferase/cytidyltransferase family protein [Actinomycetota bacterium]
MEPDGSGRLDRIPPASVPVVAPPRTSVARTVITFGTFDILHIGHLRVIDRARALGDRLVVGVSSDELNLSKKGREPVFSQDERLQIIGALRSVDAVFLEESLEAKREYVVTHGAQVLVMGDDWAGHFDELGDVCEVVYLPRTPSISTTAIIEKVAGPTAGT